MKILIIGAGAIGIAVGATLYNSGARVDFIARGATLEAINRGGIKRTGLFGDIDVAPGGVTAYGSYDDIADRQYDYVLISSKTGANAEIAERLSNCRAVMSDGGKIVIMQNGWGNDTEYVKRFGEERVYNARVITGFERTAPNVSNVTVHNAPVLLGSLFGCDNACMQPLCDALNRSWIPSELTDEIQKALWAKMLYNTTLNPLGAILGATYGELYESEYSRKIMSNLVYESYAVMDKMGYKTFWETADDYLNELYKIQIPNTYYHRSSTLQDIEKKQKTEIDTLNGCIIKLGERCGVATPTHSFIYNIIKAMEDRF